MRKSKLWKKLLGVEHLVFEDGGIDADAGGREAQVLAVRPGRDHHNRCSRCGPRCRYRDDGTGAAGGGDLTPV